MPITTVLNEFSPTPNRLTDVPEVFAQKAVISLSEQAALVPQLNNWALEANQVAQAVNQDQQTATTKAAEALSSAQSASASEISALNSRDTALASKDVAVLAAQSAGDDADRSMISRLYAEEAPDVEVEPGAYSAKHWALKAQGYAPVPSGIIVMWSGAEAQIPVGWLLCNGLNGTPNLKDRFVLSSGDAYNIGATGGSADAVVVAHSHTASTATAGGHTHTGTALTAGDHTHTVPTIRASADGDGGISTSPYATNSTRTSNTAGAHTHNLSINSAGDHSHTVTVNSAGVSGAGKNMPPYYVLAFIMKAY